MHVAGCDQLTHRAPDGHCPWIHNLISMIRQLASGPVQQRLNLRISCITVITSAKMLNLLKGSCIHEEAENKYTQISEWKLL